MSIIQSKSSRHLQETNTDNYEAIKPKQVSFIYEPKFKRKSDIGEQIKTKKLENCQRKQIENHLKKL